MERGVLGMNLSFGILSYVLPKFESNSFKRDANVSGFKKLLMGPTHFCKKKHKKNEPEANELVI